MIIKKNNSEYVGMILMENYLYLYKGDVSVFIYKCMILLCIQLNYIIGTRNNINSLYKIYVTMVYNNSESNTEIYLSNRMSDIGILRYNNLSDGYLNCYNWIASKISYYQDFKVIKLIVRVRKIK